MRPPPPPSSTWPVKSFAARRAARPETPWVVQSHSLQQPTDEFEAIAKTIVGNYG